MTLPEDHDFRATTLMAWNLIKDQLILTEKGHAWATLAHNALLVKRLPGWSLGICKILIAKVDLCDRAAATQSEIMTWCLDYDED